MTFSVRTAVVPFSHLYRPNLVEKNKSKVRIPSRGPREGWREGQVLRQGSKWDWTQSLALRIPSSVTLGGSNCPQAHSPQCSRATDRAPGTELALTFPSPPHPPQKMLESTWSFAFELQPPKSTFQYQQEVDPFVRLSSPFSCVETRMTCYLKH